MKAPKKTPWPWAGGIKGSVGKWVKHRKEQEKKKQKHKVDAWFEEHGLANAMRWAISGQGVPPPASFLEDDQDVEPPNWSCAWEDQLQLKTGSQDYETCVTGCFPQITFWHGMMAWPAQDQAFASQVRPGPGQARPNLARLE